MTDADAPYPALTPDEQLVLRTIHDWEYAPYPEIFNIGGIAPKDIPGDRVSPVPDYLIAAALRKRRHHVEPALAALVKFGLVEHPACLMKFAGAHRRLPDGAILEAECKGVSEPLAREITIIAKVDGEVCYCMSVARGTIASHSNCYTLTPTGIVKARARTGGKPETEALADAKAKGSTQVETGSPATKIEGAKVETGAPDDNLQLMRDLHAEVLEAMRKLKAISRDSRKPARDIAKATLGTDDENKVKEPLADLARWGYASSVQGRNGGSWVTKAGKQALKAYRQKGKQ